MASTVHVVVIIVCVFNFTQDSVNVSFFKNLFLIGSSVTFDYLPFCHRVAEINLNLARDRLHKLTELVNTILTESKNVADRLSAAVM